jgi:hypothetical protein
MRKLVLLALALVVAAPVAAQVHIARPTRDDAAVELAARPQPDSRTIHNLLTNGSVTLPGYPDCIGFTWHSEAVDTFGAVQVVTRIVGTPKVACVFQTQIGYATWEDAITTPSSFSNGTHSFRDGSGFSAGLGTSIRFRCHIPSCGPSTLAGSLNTALLVVKRSLGGEAVSATVRKLIDDPDPTRR